MNEKETFLQTWEREFQTTLKVLKAFPEGKLDLKPHERSRTAKDLAWTFVVEERGIIGGAILGHFDFDSLPKAPASMRDIIQQYEKSHREMVEKVEQMTEVEFHRTVKFYTGPRKISDVRRGDVMWGGVMDTVHHRGQFSVYLRMAGGAVPSIYGASADERWL